MLTLTGTLRQFGEIEFKDSAEKKGGKYLKLWLEHETPRDNGPADLKIEELLIPLEAVPASERANLKQGSVQSVVVRAWAKGRDLAFQAVRLVSQGPALQRPAEAK